MTNPVLIFVNQMWHAEVSVICPPSDKESPPPPANVVPYHAKSCQAVIREDQLSCQLLCECLSHSRFDKERFTA
jgi:hypothetical protein